MRGGARRACLFPSITCRYACNVSLFGYCTHSRVCLYCRYFVHLSSFTRLFSYPVFYQFSHGRQRTSLREDPHIYYHYMRYRRGAALASAKGARIRLRFPHRTRTHSVLFLAKWCRDCLLPTLRCVFPSLRLGLNALVVGPTSRQVAS